MLKTEPTAGIESKRTTGERGCAIKRLDHSRTTQRGSSKQCQLINRLRVGIPNKGKVSETFLVPIIQITFFINRLKVKPFHLFTHLKRKKSPLRFAIL